MEPDPDELAGAVDLFGGLTRDELRRGFEDLAAREGESFDPRELDNEVDRAVEEFYLVEVSVEGGAVLAAGPTALPRLPAGGEDLPHLLSVDERAVKHEAIAGAVSNRLEADAERAVDEDDTELAVRLLDVCYEAEAWGSIDTGTIRERLDNLLR